MINTLGGAGAERALLELLTRFNPDKYEISLYVLLGQGELIHQVPDYVRIWNQEYFDGSVLSRRGKLLLNKRLLKRIFVRKTIFRDCPYLIKNLGEMLKKGKIQADKLLWKVMSDSGQMIREHFDLAVAYLEGGSTYFVHDYVDAEKKAAFIHVDYEWAGYSRSLDRDCYQEFGRIFTVSDEVKQSFLNVYPECSGKTYVFHNLINQEEIRRKAEQPGGFEDFYDGKRILTVGRLTSQKAYEFSIDAMKLLKDHGVKARWYVLGEGELREKLQHKINRLGLKNDFILLGAKENPFPYYKQCDLYVHASRFEGKSISIQEAQTLGCTLVVSDCSGNREQVVPGVDGMMCHLDAKEICDTVEALLKDEEKCKELGKKAAEKGFLEDKDVLKWFDF